MSNTQEGTSSRGRLLDELERARSKMQVQLHLLSMDAKDRWRQIEPTLDNLEYQINQSSEQALDALAAKLSAATRAVTDLISTAERSHELANSVKSVMTTPVNACLPHDSANRAAQLLWETDCGALPVVLTDGTLVGMVTDRDICMAAYTQGRPLSEISVKSAMAQRVYSCSQDAAIERVLTIMREEKVRRVPVTTRGCLVGIVSLADLVLWAKASGQSALYGELMAVLACICERKSESQALAAE